MAKNSGPKKPKLNRNSPEYKETLVSRKERFKGHVQDKEKQRKRYALKQGFAERLFGSYGFGEEIFEDKGFVKGKLGMFAQAMSQKTTTQSDAPNKIQPSRNIIAASTNAGISTIIQVLTEILKVATQIGAVTTQQQDMLRRQINHAQNDAKEADMERGTAALNATNMLNSGTDLSTLNETIGTLIEKIKPLSNTVNDKVKEQEDEQGKKGFAQRLAESYGFGDEYETRTKRTKAREERIKTKPGYKRVLGRDGRVTYRSSNGRIVSATEAIAQRSSKLEKLTGAAKTISKSAVGFVGKASGSFGKNIATKIGGAGIAIRESGVSKKIAGMLGNSIRGASAASEAAEHVGPSVIKRIAGPIIEKALGSTILKSIPIIGTVAGGLFAAKRLVEGDPVGAGLDAASGLAGPATAIPAMIASTARDTYSSVFRVQPEQDPHFTSRMAMITGVISAMVAAMLAPKIKKENQPSKADIDKAVIPKKPIQQLSGQTPTGQPAIPNPPSPPPQPPANNGGTSASSSGTKSKPAKLARKSGGSSGDAKMAKDDKQVASMVTNPPTTGAELTQKTAEVEQAANQTTVANFDKGRPLPSTNPPIKNGVSGVGDVPDPNYNNYGPDIISQIWSSVVLDSSLMA